MSSSTSSSNRPWQFAIGFALFVLAFELVIGSTLPKNLGRHEVDRCVARLQTNEGTAETLLLSDSVSYGVLGPEGAPDVVDCTSNQAIGVVGNYFLVRRWLEARRKAGRAGAGMVLYVAHPTAFEVNLQDERFLQSYFLSVFNERDEIANVDESLQRPELVRRMRMEHYNARLSPPSYLRSGNVTDPLWDQLRKGRDRFAPQAFHVPESVAPGVRAEIERLSAHESIRPSKESKVYAAKLAELAEHEGFRLILVRAPLAPTVRSEWSRRGVLRDYDHLLGGLTKSHPRVSFETSPYQPDDDRYFRDAMHLQLGAMPEYRRAFLGWLRGAAEGRDR